nr:MAG TPA: hypothetical protein [Caudoviricetes sp.]
MQSHDIFQSSFLNSSLKLNTKPKVFVYLLPISAYYIP